MATGDKMLTALLIVLSLNLIMFIVGFGMNDLTGVNPYVYADNTLSTFNTGNSTHFEVPSNASRFLPGGSAEAVDPDTGFSITDIFRSVKNWVIDATGIGWVLSILQGPKVLLTTFGLPEAAAWAITALWYGITLLIIVAFIWGR